MWPGRQGDVDPTWPDVLFFRLPGGGTVGDKGKESSTDDRLIENTNDKEEIMKKGMVLTAALAMGMGFGIATWATAGGGLQAPAEPITIEGKKPATFNHATHAALGLACGSCHHDAKHQPLTAEAISALPSGDQLACASCHNEKFANAKLQKRMDVFHARCKECHEAGVNGKKGPTKCNDCHLQKKKKAVEGC
jgi:hypothetical protein